jgi:DNA-binding LytR/AlgR family response regulator
MIKAIAIDDEPLALKIIERFCAQSAFIDLQKTFTQTSEAIQYLKTNLVDLLLLDVNMPACSGIDFYKQLVNNPMVIFTTAYSEYAVEGFNLQAIDYLLKPFSYDRFAQAIEKANEAHLYSKMKESSEELFISVRADYSLIKIYLSDILFIEGLDNYLKIHLEHQKPIVARMAMKTILDKLPDTTFIRVHRSFIVPFCKVKSVRNKMISIGTHEIPIGSSYEQVFFKHFKQ